MANKSGYSYHTDVGIYEDKVPKLIMEFLETEASNCVSPNTISQHYYCLKDFFQYVSWSARLCGKDVHSRVQLFRKGAEDFNIADVSEEMILGCTKQDLISYKNYIHTVLNPDADEKDQVAINKVTTARVKIYAIKCFYRWLYESEHLDKDPMLSVHADKKQVDKDGEHAIYLELDEVKDLLNNVNEEHYERDLCILIFFLNTGMRLSELVALDVDSIDLDGKMVTIEKGKGGARRRVPLNDACVEQYLRYMKERQKFLESIHYVENPKDTKPLFLSRQNKRISRRRVQNIVEVALGKAGLSGRGFSTHKLRHTAATMMYNNGATLNDIKEVLGHNVIQTTTIYAHPSEDAKRFAVDSNPLGKLNIDEFTPTKITNWMSEDP